MPRPDGRLYPSEIAALEPPKVPQKRGPKPKPKPPGSELIPAPARKAKRTKPTLPERRSLDEVVAEGAKLAGWKAPVGLGQGGPRLKATPEMIADIIRCVRGGLTIDRAINYAGISKAAVEKWRRQNETLSQVFEKAEMDSEMELVAYIQKAADKDHKAAAWLLERRHSWLAVTRSELTGKDGGPMQVLTIHKQLLERVAKGGDKPVINVTATHAKD